jgi:hypothetical protein
MEKIEFLDDPSFRIKTYTKGEAKPSSYEEGGLAFESEEILHPYGFHHADELPFFYFVPKKGLFGGMLLTPETSLQEKLFHDFGTILQKEKIDPQDVVCYFGPSLTFSHVAIERPTLLKIMAMGYRAAAKRTSGVDYFDVPMMNFLMLRKLGVPAKNITLDAHDTFEDEDLLFSAKRGDKEKNLTLIERLK